MSYAEWRPGDQRVYVSDTSKAERVLGWKAETPWESGLERLVEWLHAVLDGWGELVQTKVAERVADEVLTEFRKGGRKGR